MAPNRKRSDVEKYLSEEFPDHPPAKVLAAFSHAFFDGQYKPTDGKKVWKAQHGKRRKEAPMSERQKVEQRIKLEEIWHQNYPKTGGSDPADYILADWVKMGFEELEEPITFGISSTHPPEPSTPFGRVVAAALRWRNSSADWRRVAQNSFQEKYF